jgi:ribonucleoside-triphosphate reductase (formate)
MTELKRQKCEIFSRVVGYVRRIESWNYGKRAEYHDRKLFKVTEK